MFFKKIVILLIFFLIIVGCATSTKSIRTKSDKFHGKKVTIKGEVISSLDLRDINCFTLKDKKGHILVVTDNLLPLKKDRIKVKGVVDKNYSYKKRTLLVLVEKKMKLKKPAKLKKILKKMP